MRGFLIQLVTMLRPETAYKRVLNTVGNNVATRNCLREGLNTVGNNVAESARFQSAPAPVLYCTQFKNEFFQTFYSIKASRQEI